MSGTVTFSKNLTQTFNKAIEAIDAKLSKQLSAIMHHEVSRSSKAAGAASTTWSRTPKPAPR